MKDKEKQIEEMANLIYDNRPIKDIWIEEATDIARILFVAGYRKLPKDKDSVVLSKEEYEKLTAPRVFVSKTHLNNKVLIDDLKRVGNYGIVGAVSASVKLLPTRAKIEKETAEKILDFIQENRHKYEMWYLVSELRKFFGIEQNNDWVFGDLADELKNKFGGEIKE